MPTRREIVEAIRLGLEASMETQRDDYPLQQAIEMFAHTNRWLLVFARAGDEARFAEWEYKVEHADDIDDERAIVERNGGVVLYCDSFATYLAESGGN